MRDAIIAVVGGNDLSQDDAAMVMEQMMNGEASPAQIAALLTALHLKGETAHELAGMALVMRAKSTAVPHDGPLVDTCGTGGDHASTFNISTAAAFVAAGAGAIVAKHGNRAMSSRCGSADVLEALGVNIELDADGVARCLAQAGIGFMFAPKFHPAMRYAGPVRREIGIRTAFNLLGPLTNPARAQHQVIGVANAALAEKLAHTLSYMNTSHALVVHGHDGLDEISLSGPSLAFDVHGGQTPRQFSIDPQQLGLQLASRDALLGGTAPDNAHLIRAILSGADDGPRRDIVLLNAAAALVAADRASTLVEGLEFARHSIDAGHAAASLDALVRVSQKAGG